MYVVGIAGGTASGKSYLAEFLKNALGDRATVVCQDWYYRDHSHLRPEQCSDLNFDHPKAIENRLFLRHVDRLRRGESVEAPRYDYASHGRLKETRRIRPADILLLEGLFILHEKSLLKRLDLPVFIDAPDDLRLLRRVRRDCAERRIDLEETLRLYESFVRPMHARFIAPSVRNARAVWRQPGDKDFPKKLLGRLRKKLAAR